MQSSRFRAQLQPFCEDFKACFLKVRPLSVNFLAARQPPELREYGRFRKDKQTRFASRPPSCRGSSGLCSGLCLWRSAQVLPAVALLISQVLNLGQALPRPKATQLTLKHGQDFTVGMVLMGGVNGGAREGRSDER